MRRLIITFLMLLGLLLAAAPAEARWGCGWGGGFCGYRGCGFGGYRGCGYGGCGYRNFCGYGGYGGYCGYGGYYGGLGCGGLGYGRSVFSYGFAQPYYAYPSLYYPRYYSTIYNGGYGGYGGFGGFGYNAPVSVGYYASQPGGYYNANANFAVASLPSVKYPISATINAQTLQQFLGLKSELALAAAAPKATVPAVSALSDTVLPKMSARVSNADARQRAMRFLAEGDTLFLAQNFNSALQKYKLAASAAPDVAEAYWRQGHAFVATKNFGLATTAFKRAIALTDNLGRGGFQLDDLYGGGSLAKAAHLENLAELALTREADSDAYFLIGLFLNYDGQTARAEKFFERAASLAGISGGHIAVFLDHGAPGPVLTARPPAPRTPTPATFISAGAEI